MRHTLVVEFLKMPAVICYYCTILLMCELKHILVRNTHVNWPRFLNGQHIMTSRPQEHHYRQWDILIRIKQRHNSRLLVLDDLLLDFVCKLIVIHDGGLDIGRFQSWIHLKKLEVTDTQLQELDDYPHRNA